MYKESTIIQIDRDKYQKSIENAVNTAIDAAIITTQKSIAIQLRGILYSPDNFDFGKIYKVIDEMDKGELKLDYE